MLALHLLLTTCTFTLCVSCLQHLGRVHVAAFSDTLLHNELISKALFWQQTSFYGIDMTPLHQPAVDGYFQQVGRDVAGAALIADAMIVWIFVNCAVFTPPVWS